MVSFRSKEYEIVVGDPITPPPTWKNAPEELWTVSVRLVPELHTLFIAHYSSEDAAMAVAEMLGLSYAVTAAGVITP